MPDPTRGGTRPRPHPNLGVDTKNVLTVGETQHCLQPIDGEAVGTGGEEAGPSSGTRTHPGVPYTSGTTETTGSGPVGDTGERLGERGSVEGDGGVKTIRGSGNCRDWNGITYKTGMSAQNVGAKALSMNVATIPPGGVAFAHIHVGFEVMLYILEGRVRHEYGPELERVIENQAGDFVYIEPGVPHEVFNMSDSEPVVAVVARSDAEEWEHIVPFSRPEPRRLS